MLSTYCQECGHKNEYVSKRPKFCGNCGNPLSSDVEKPAIKRKTIPRKTSESRVVEDHDEDGTDVYEVPKISNFEYEIEYDQSDMKKTLGSFLPQPEAQPQPKKKRGRPRKTSQANGKKKKN